MFRTTKVWLAVMLLALFTLTAWAQDEHAGHNHAQDEHAGHDHAQEETAQEEAAQKQPSMPEGVDPLPSIGPKIQEMIQGQKFQEMGDYLEKQITFYKEIPGIWFQYGYARHMTGDYETSLSAWKKAEELGMPPNVQPTLKFNLACALSKLERVDEGLEYLDKAVDLGVEANMVETDSDLDNLRKDDRFAAILAKAKGEQ